MSDLNKKINKALKYGKSLIGVPYKWWIPKDGLTTIDYKGSPFYSDEVSYSSKYVFEHGVNCAGFINLIAKHIDIKPNYGTLMWMNRHISVLVPFEPKNIDTYQKGSILIRYYRSSTDQGHMAIIYDKNKILHAYSESNEPQEGLFGPGAVIDTLSEAIGQLEDPYYDYVIRPEDWICHQ